MKSIIPHCPVNGSIYRIGFLQSRRHADNMMVTFCNPAIPARKKAHRQEIVVLPRSFYRIVPEAAGLGFAGCVDVTVKQLRELGFNFDDRLGVAAV